MSRSLTAARVSDLQPTAVNRILQEVRAVQAEGKSVASLMRGQPDAATPEHIVEAARQALRDGRTGYPDNQGELTLREAVSEKLSGINGVVYDPGDEVIITDGATQGISVALAAMLEPGDEVLLPDPIYDAYASAIVLWGGRPVPVASTIAGGRFCLGRDALEEAYTPRCHCLLLNTPWNPVGTVLSRDELAAIMDFAGRHDLFVLSDEVYESFVYDGRQHLSPASLSAEARGRTLVINSLSKTYAMTGWRVGYCAGPAAVVGAMLLVLQQSSRGPATFVQDAAVAALRSDQSPVRRMVEEFQARRDRCVRRLNDVAGVERLVPEGGFFVMADVRQLGMSSDTVRQVLLREAGVAVVHGAAYGPGGEGTLRVSFAAGGRALEDGLDRLCEGLRRLTSDPRVKGSR